MPIHNKTCAYCGAQFQSGRADALYCSAKCRLGGHVNKTHSPTQGTTDKSEEAVTDWEKRALAAESQLNLLIEQGFDTVDDVLEAVTNWRNRALEAEKTAEPQDKETLHAGINAALKKYQ